LYKDLGSSLYDQTSFCANILEADLQALEIKGKERRKTGCEHERADSAKPSLEVTRTRHDPSRPCFKLLSIHIASLRILVLTLPAFQTLESSSLKPEPLMSREILAELQLHGNAIEKQHLMQRFKLKTKKGQWLAPAAGHVGISVTPAAFLRGISDCGLI
jgi:hypothetical protein